jgi:septum formation protein
MSNTDPQIVLASASPRRAELLRQMRITYRIVPAAVDESARPGESAVTLAERLAAHKAQSVARGEARRDPHAALPVLGADTVVTLDGTVVLGKPQDRMAAIAMLQSLSGREHQVLTAVAIAHGARLEVRVGSACVRFRTLDAREIEQYVASAEGMDKAGGYGIQGIGGIFAEHIEGSYSAIVGLPLVETEMLLRAFGVATWRNRGT